MLGIAFGTRPEWLKIKPLVKELDERNIKYHLIWTGQHTSLLKDEIDKDMASVRRMLTNYNTGLQRLDSLVHGIMADSQWLLYQVDSLLVQGDTTSAFAMALAAFHRNIPVIHLEAGLRTHDLGQPFPEEGNRQMITAISHLHLCPTKDAARNVAQTGPNRKIHIVGNTVLDNLHGIETSVTDKVLVTLHRRENQENMDQWFLAVEELAQNNTHVDFILPIHPNPMVKKHEHLLSRVKVVEPLEHSELLKLLSECKVVITDSGGLQEESAFLRKPCVVCREKTERQEGLDNFSVLCDTPGRLRDRFLDAQLRLKMEGPCPYGDGFSSKKIVDILEDERLC